MGRPSWKKLSPPPPPPPPHPTYNESQLPHTHTKLPGYGIITVQIPNRSTISLSECVIIISIQVATDIIRHLEDKCLIRSYIASTNMHQTAVMLLWLLATTSWCKPTIRVNSRDHDTPFGNRIAHQKVS